MDLLKRNSYLWRWRLTLCLLLCLMSLSGHCAEQAGLYVDIGSGMNEQIRFTLDAAPPDTAIVSDAIGKSLGGTLQDVHEGMAEDGRWLLRAHCDGAMHRQGFAGSGEIHPAPLLTVLRGLETPWLGVYITHPNFAAVQMMPERSVLPAWGARTTHYFPIQALDEQANPSIRFQISVSPLVWMRTFGPPALVLLLTIALTFWARQRALKSNPTEPTAIWYGYYNFTRGVTMGMWLLWLALLFETRLNRFLSYLTGSMSAESDLGGFFLAAYIPPLLTLLICAGLGHAVYARMRGVEWTRADLISQSFWNLAYRVFHLGLLLTGIGALIDNEPRRMVIWFAAAYVTRQFCAQQYLRVSQLNLLGITFGELRDRIFGLAQKASVKMQQIYLIPAGKGRLANAYAMKGGRVLLTDYLLQHLSKREIDAIVGHELTHLQHQHPIKLARVISFSIVLPIMMALLLSWSYHWDINDVMVYAPLVIVLGLLLFYFFSRRYEHVADAGAVALTGDAEGLITGLIKLSALNRMPLSWDRWEEGTRTHPSTLRRIQEIARYGAVSPERLQELLAGSEIHNERYPLPPGLEENRIYSTTYKSRTQQDLFWTQYGAMLLPPALVAWLVQTLEVSGALVWIFWAIGLAATVGIYLMTLNLAMLSRLRKLAQPLRDRFEQEGLPIEEGNSHFVTLSPDSSPRNYEGATSWDIGFCFLSGEHLVYIGEQTRFALNREQITMVRLRAGWPGWWPAPNVQIRWRNEGGEEGFCLIRIAECATVLQTALAVRALEARIQSWLKETPIATKDPSIALPSPSPIVVTSMEPRAIAVPGVVFSSLVFMTLLASGLALLLGLSFLGDKGGSAYYLIGTAAFMAVFQWLPYLRKSRSGT